ncbi:amino acid adenylation domain-containing protein [Streptomyces sp. NPDC004629]|uniref:non-ribosomal peptide synthetase n=1 Tax=Streptomyces sp. NPDC004629 TaxID=3364705 RepID=UPI0036A7D0F7
MRDVLDFWRDELSGLEPLEPPTDRPRPAARAGTTARHAFTVPAVTADALRKAAAQHGTTPDVLLLAAYQALLGLYSRRRDIAVGVPAHGTTVVVRTDLDGDPTFGALAVRVAAGVERARAHARLPFERLVAALAPEPDTGHHPLVQALFNAAPAAGACPPDLALDVADGGEPEPVAHLTYRTELFDRESAERLAGTYLTLLAAATAEPGAPLSALDPLTAGERRRLLTEWAVNPVACPTDRGVPDLVAEQAARRPDAVAVVFAGGQLTYRQLVARSEALAGRLHALGVGRDVPVGVCLERGPELIVALLAVLRAGGAYVPLDPEHPAQRLEFVLRDTGAPVLIAPESLRGRLARGRTLVLPDEADDAAEAPRDTPAGRPGDLAYVLYTSGSTGTPKGVAVTVGSLVNLLFAMRTAFPPPASETVLFATSPTFDIANVEMFLPLVTGGRLVVADKDQARTPRALAALIDTHRVTLVQATPSAWRALVAALSERPAARGLTVLSAGEPLPADLAATMLTVGDRVVNGYGPTEATIYATLAEIRDPARGVPIGRPTANTEVYVVDEHDRPVPVGVPGELLIGGAGVARGYLGRPELTAERFTVHPFRDDPAPRVYRTGDLARWRPDGTLEFLGRLDHQVKVRGFRIELGEVESVLTAHADVASCAVTVREDVPGDKALVAYCVPAAGRTLSVTALREWCGRTLPGYMIPSAFVFLTGLPLSSSGKTDRAALPAPDGDRGGLDAAYVAPRTPAERAVARIWSAALWADEVGAHDDFFELGGDSLIATRVALRLQEEFALEVPVQALFTHTTVQALARALTAARRSGGGVVV